MRWLLPDDLLQGTTAGELAVVLILGLLLVPVLIVVADALAVRRALRGEVEGVSGDGPWVSGRDASVSPWPAGEAGPPWDPPPLPDGRRGPDDGSMEPMASGWPSGPASGQPVGLPPRTPWTDAGPADLTASAWGRHGPADPVWVGPQAPWWPAWSVPHTPAPAVDEGSLTPAPLPEDPAGAPSIAAVAPDAGPWSGRPTAAPGGAWHLSPLVAAGPDRQPPLLLADGHLAPTLRPDAPAPPDGGPAPPLVDPQLEPSP